MFVKSLPGFYKPVFARTLNCLFVPRGEFPAGHERDPANTTKLKEINNMSEHNSHPINGREVSGFQQLIDLSNASNKSRDMRF